MTEFGTGFLAKLAPETVSVPYVLTIPMTFAAKANADAVAAIRDWCDSAADMHCSHTTEDECRRCEAIKDCAAAVRTLLPAVDESVSDSHP